MILQSDIIDPLQFSDMAEWADYSAYLFEELGVIDEKVMKDTDWRKWASNLIVYPGVASLSPPNPYLYKDWKSWALVFNQTVSAG